MENKSVMFLKNHGVIAVGDTVAQAYRLLYKLERACKTQVLAMGTGQAIHVLEQSVIDKVRTPSVDDRHPRSERERLYFAAMMRVIDRINPGYAD
jgi:ribulose-5-phosphate 4-epimerase/fuculose-1-phosphate aldolase